MKKRQLLVMAAAALACVIGTTPVHASGKVYSWVDENGVRHFGDAIPPEYSRQRHEVLDSRGVRTTVHEEKKAEPSAVRDDRDRALLATYGTVAEIEAVRDRRAGYLEDQNAVAIERLESLHTRREQLVDNPATINELATVEQRIREYDAEIQRRNTEIERIRAQFDDDILRFRELKGLAGPEEAAAKAVPAADR